MTREEAIKEIRSWDFLEGKEIEAIHTLIPELAESEDERIRKDIVAAVETYGDFTQGRKEEIYAYLEKQKEPHYTKRNALFDKCIENCDPKVMKEVSNKVDEMLGKEQKLTLFSEPHNPDDYEVVMQGNATGLKRKEQKPEEWSDTDNIGWDEAFACVTRAEKSAKNEEELQNAVTAEKWLKEIKFKYYVHPDKQKWSEEDEQKDGVEPVDWSKTKINGKPVSAENNAVHIRLSEWSHEDEKNLELVTDCVYEFYPDPVMKYKLKDWLESLRPQPKDETYKEKDEAFKLGKHQLAIKFMNYLDENRPEGKMGLSNSECEDIDKAFKENDWAKIMRYVKKYSPSWKPSEEQMKHLERCFSHGHTVGLPNQHVLESLYNDLKKLM